MLVQSLFRTSLLASWCCLSFQVFSPIFVGVLLLFETGVAGVVVWLLWFVCPSVHPSSPSVRLSVHLFFLLELFISGVRS